jgi:hypothetical protein
MAGCQKNTKAHHRWQPAAIQTLENERKYCKTRGKNANLDKLKINTGTKCRSKYIWVSPKAIKSGPLKLIQKKSKKNVTMLS